MHSLEDVRLFMLDMDGTFYLGEQIIPGSLEFIDAVVRSGRDYLFVTNNSSHNALHYVKKLARMGLSIGREKVLTSGEATAAAMRRRFPGKRPFILGNSFLVEEFAEAGIQATDTDPDYVVVGFDTTLDYAKMTVVCDFVRAGLPYIATHPDFNCPTETGFIPDIGAIMAFIEASTGRKADLIIGKPYGGIVDAALERTGLERGQLAMVGDRLYTDIETGNRHGMTSILVMSGETTAEMRDASEIKAHLVYDRLADMIPLL